MTDYDFIFYAPFCAWSSIIFRHFVGKEQRMVETYSNYAYYRNKKDLTDYKLSQLCGVNRSTLSDWKSGKHQPQAKTLKKIAQFLGVDVNDFYRTPGQGKFKAHSSPTAHNNAICYEGEEIEHLPVSGYTIVLSDNRKVNLTSEEYFRLKTSIDAFIDSWINVNIGV